MDELLRKLGMLKVAVAEYNTNFLFCAFLCAMIFRFPTIAYWNILNHYPNSV